MNNNYDKAKLKVYFHDFSNVLATAIVCLENIGDVFPDMIGAYKSAVKNEPERFSKIDEDQLQLLFNTTTAALNRLDGAVSELDDLRKFLLSD